MSGRLALIGAPSSAGAYAPGQERTPGALRDAGLPARWMRRAGPSTTAATCRLPLDPGPGGPARGQRRRRVAARWRPTSPAVSPRSATGRSARWCSAATHGRDRLGGRLVGRGRVGLVYVDLHADLNVPGSTGDGTLNWMGLAHLLAVDGARRVLADVGLRTPLLTGADGALPASTPIRQRRSSWRRSPTTG